MQPFLCKNPPNATFTSDFMPVGDICSGVAATKTMSEISAVTPDEKTFFD